MTSYSLLPLIWNQVVSLFFRNQVILRTKPPKKIGDYTLVKEKLGSGSGETVVSLYKNQKGQKVVVKMWSGRTKDYIYYSLLNEYESYVSMHKILDNHLKIKKGLDKIKFPEVIDFINNGSSVYLIIEYIEGKTINKFNQKIIIDTYFKVVDFFEVLYKNASKKDLRKISKRYNFHYIFLYPFLFVLAFIRNPKQFLNLIKSFWIYLKGIFILIFSNKYSLVHRDLNFENIIISGENIYVIDPQLMTISYKVCDYATTLRYCYDKNIFKEVFLDAVLKKCTRKERKVFGVISNDIAVHNVAQITGEEDPFSKARINMFIFLIWMNSII